jgi:hypothetical protein
MGEKKDFTAKVKKTRDVMHQQGKFVALLLLLKQGLAKAGIVLTPFYYMKEVLTSDIPPHLTTLPEGFEFSTFDREDVEAISNHPERKGYVNQPYVINNFNKGDTCLGIKHKGEIAGFTWFSTKENRDKFYQSIMKANEAYLYDMFILKSFRGHNLAPTLRFKNYEILKSLGRDTFYSITECSNTASYRFKEKLGSRIVFLGVHVRFFKKRHKTFVVRKYEDDGPAGP